MFFDNNLLNRKNKHRNVMVTYIISLSLNLNQNQNRIYDIYSNNTETLYSRNNFFIAAKDKLSQIINK